MNAEDMQRFQVEAVAYPTECADVVLTCDRCGHTAEVEGQNTPRRAGAARRGAHGGLPMSRLSATLSAETAPPVHRGANGSPEAQEAQQ